MKKKIIVKASDAPVTRAMFLKAIAEMRARHSGHDKRFVSIERRFDSIDKRFDSVDKRFESMDKRFDSIDKRFDSLEKKIDSYKDEIKGMYHKTQAEMEEQSANNRAMFDAIGAMQDWLKRSDERHEELRKIVYNAKLPREI